MERFNTTVSRRGNCAVEQVVGEVDIATHGLLRQALQTAHDDCPHLVIDASNLTFIDSLGLNELIHLAKAAARDHGTVATACASPLVKRIFTLTQLTPLIHLYPSVS